MPPLITCTGITKAFGGRALFEDLSLFVAENARIGVIGANGSGKSTLLRVVAGLEEPDAGERTRQRNLRIGMVEQDPRFEPGKSASEAIAAASSRDDVGDRQIHASAILSRLGFPDPDQRVDTLSGGWQKRLAIARALVDDPELLLLDEPTNHLDLEGILWLERFLGAAHLAFIVVTHDRALLHAVATRIIELDPRYPGGLLSSDGDYARFLENREAVLASRTQRELSLANRVRREIEWLRRGPKARTGKSQSRIDQAGVLIDELQHMRSRRPNEAAVVDLASTQRKTRLLLSARSLSKDMGGRCLFSGVDLLLGPGVRVGLVGPNGSGKTTLLKLLAGEILPDKGTIVRAESLRVAIFEQRRTWDDPNATLRRVLAPDGDSVLFRGQSLHVVSWARRFGFYAAQLDFPISQLSGGEQARVSIARLMQEPADVLLLDEPTNDLDIPTLEALEESLFGFEGAVVLVTHDRYLMDRVVDLMLGLDGRGHAELVADIAQWERIVERAEPVEKKPTEQVARPKRQVGLSTAERRELATIEETILGAEAELGAAREAAANPAIATDAAALDERYTEMEAAEAEVRRLYDRWAELDMRHRSQERRRQ
jgi:ABC transport system ATP-binding/permease protein